MLGMFGLRNGHIPLQETFSNLALFRWLVRAIRKRSGEVATWRDVPRRREVLMSYVDSGAMLRVDIGFYLKHCNPTES